jgi:hypothetical protein
MLFDTDASCGATEKLCNRSEPWYGKVWRGLGLRCFQPEVVRVYLQILRPGRGSLADLNRVAVPDLTGHRIHAVALSPNNLDTRNWAQSE